jgi:hypothetical protein
MTNNNIEIAQRWRQCLAQNEAKKDDSGVFKFFFVFLLCKCILVIYSCFQNANLYQNY